MIAGRYVGLTAVLLCACVGTDQVDDPIIGVPSITIDAENVALEPGSTRQLNAVYTDQYGLEPDVPFQWFTSDSDVATVEDGLVTAHSPGHADIVAVYDGAESDQVLITVVSGADDVAEVLISAAATVLEVGQTTILSASVRNIEGEELGGKTIEWFSDNTEVFTVDASGLVEGTGPGSTEVYARVEGVRSNSLSMLVGSVRLAAFQPSGGYTAEGSATLFVENNEVILMLSGDFMTSFALGTFIYLSNTTNDQAVVDDGLELGQIFENGTHTINVSNIDPAVDLYDFRYVMIMCKPAEVKFGYADLGD